jgi:hypothetical protein
MLGQMTNESSHMEAFRPPAGDGVESGGWRRARGFFCIQGEHVRCLNSARYLLSEKRYLNKERRDSFYRHKRWRSHLQAKTSQDEPKAEIRKPRPSSVHCLVGPGEVDKRQKQITSSTRSRSWVWSSELEPVLAWPVAVSR